MQLQRNEIMTGLLVIGTVAVLAFVLVLLGAPGLFRPLVTYKIYFDNAAGIKIGAPVMLAGRKIGQVQKLFSPVSRDEDERAQRRTPNCVRPRRARHQRPRPPRATQTNRNMKCESRCRWIRMQWFIAMRTRG